MSETKPTVRNDIKSEGALHATLLTLRQSKPDDRSEKDRYYAVTITMIEQAYAYFSTFVEIGEG